MPSDHMERILVTPLVSPTFAEPSAVFAEISESGWTMYFDQSLDSWRNKITTSGFDIEKQHKKNWQYTENVDQTSSISGNEEDSSMASDASSGPQKMPMPLSEQDIQFDEHRPVAGSYSLDSRRKRGANDKYGDLECVASCSSVDLSFTRKKSRKVNKKEDEHELAPWLQDTASSHILRPEVQEVNMRFEVLQPLLHDGEKIGRERCGRAIEYNKSRDE